jgi:hypothetical protein
MRWASDGCDACVRTYDVDASQMGDPVGERVFYLPTVTNIGDDRMNAPA